MKNIFVFIAAVALLLAVNARAAAISEKLRVLSVDLENAVIGNPGMPGGEIAQDLRTLLEKADPDVVLLQGATDWESCERICKLKPGFPVITCSAFPAKSENSAAPQVAILARDRAVISWVEEMPDGSGFGFGLLEAGSRKLGVFTLQTPKMTSPSFPASEGILAQIAKLQKFPQNRPDAFLVAGGPVAKTSAVIDAGLQNIAPDAQGKIAASRAEFWVANAGFIARPRPVAIQGLRQPALVCDFDAGSAFSSKFAYQTPLLFAGETPATLQAAAAPVAPPPETRSLAWPVAIMATVVLLLAFMVFRGGNRQPQMQLAPMNSPGGVMLANQADPVRMNLLAWFKSLFVQRLVSQRQQLLANEDEATRRSLVIEEKLSNLQSSLQTRISAYETRIERLEHELTAATVENRDLIRSQIDLLKEKVAKAREEQTLRRN